MSFYLDTDDEIEIIDYANFNSARFSPVVDDDSGWLRSAGPWVRGVNNDLAMRHCIIGADIGRSTDFAIRVTWLHTDWLDLFGQIGPLCWIPWPPSLGHDRQDLGLGIVNDLGLGGAGYGLYGFSCPMTELFLHKHYDTIIKKDVTEGSLDSSPSLWGWGERTTTFEMVVATNRWYGYVEKNGIRNQVCELPVPEQLRDNTIQGVHVIDAKPRPGLEVWNWDDVGFTGPDTYDTVPPAFEFKVEIETL